MHIRPAADSDLSAITAITNDVIRTTTAMWTDIEATVGDRAAWMKQRITAGYPVLVADSMGEVIGFASYGPYRSGPPGYRYVVEHSIHVARDARGRGVGSQLVTALLDHARQQGLWAMVGGIDALSTASLRMHARLGFVEVGRQPGIGSKFGQRLDLVLMQRAI